jgi:hypothetical protein
MSENNPEFESQWKGSPLAEAMGKAYQVEKEFYREYVTDDYDHEVIARVPKDVAIAMVMTSPYLPFLAHGRHVGPGWDETDPIVWVMNKGAVRITPSPEFLDRLIELELWKDEEWPSRHPERDELWVFNQDGAYSLTRPRIE